MSKCLKSSILRREECGCLKVTFTAGGSRRAQELESESAATRHSSGSANPSIPAESGVLLLAQLHSISDLISSPFNFPATPLDIPHQAMV
ncbi:hypothetical protein E2C01_089553 [Portunus trituberculatus]|uniref:Uncharacterized protein n=1 Tax=Portunus trituberculatus TaxID=210409 RepID=A0A5B7JJB9_PORTR|nr:hypothetical protein [Portunus trituberculatus]